MFYSEVTSTQRIASEIKENSLEHHLKVKFNSFPNRSVECIV